MTSPTSEPPPWWSADFFTADVRTRLFTHYRREEDTEMESGKLDEERPG